MHPVDAKERNHLYKFNETVADQLVENLAILLESPDKNEREEQIEFPSVDQMMNIIKNKNKENTSTNQTWKLWQPLPLVGTSQKGAKNGLLGSLLENMMICYG